MAAKKKAATRSPTSGRKRASPAKRGRTSAKRTVASKRSAAAKSGRSASAKKKKGGPKNFYRGIVRTLCRDGTINTAHALATSCSVAYGNAEAANYGFCLGHGGLQKHTRVSCKAE